MATDPYWQLEKEYTTIAEQHDLTIKAVEYEQVQRTENEKTVTDSAPCKVHEFRVKREVLSTASPVLRKLLTAGFKEAEQTTVELHGDPAKALGIWFNIFHADADNLEAAKFTYDDVALKDVWQVLSTAHKYEINPKDAKAKAWFEGWYNAQAHKDGHRFGYLDFQALIFPCHAFDYAFGFAFATKQLVYRSNGHITERQPRDFEQDNLHLDPIIIQQLNAAKGRLKTILHRELYNPIEGLLKRATCPCRAGVLFAFEKGLANTGAWPLETNFSTTSVNDILRKLQTFGAPFQLQTCGHPLCSFNFAEKVGTACEKTRSYFDGLCLDCISLSKPKFGDHDEDYWQHAAHHVPWDQDCRVRHKQPSWYFSFMGRRQKMVQWTKERKNGPHVGAVAGGGGGGQVFEAYG